MPILCRFHPEIQGPSEWWRRLVEAQGVWSWSPRIPVDPFPKVGGGSHAEDDLMPLLAPAFRN